MILRQRPGNMIEHQLAAVERSLVEADADRANLEQAVAGLDPERVTGELKAALRAPAVDQSLIDSLRRRHETVNDLLNRLDDLDRRVAVTVADLETLAARVSVGAVGQGGDRAQEELAQLELDVEALAAAHREIEDL